MALSEIRIPTRNILAHILRDCHTILLKRLPYGVVFFLAIAVRSLSLVHHFASNLHCLGFCFFKTHFYRGVAFCFATTSHEGVQGIQVSSQSFPVISASVVFQNLPGCRAHPGRIGFCLCGAGHLSAKLLVLTLQSLHLGFGRNRVAFICGFRGCGALLGV